MNFTIDEGKFAIVFQINAFTETQLVKGLCGLSISVIPSTLLYMAVLNESYIALVYEKSDSEEFIKGINEIIGIYNTEEFNRVFDKEVCEFWETCDKETATDEQLYKFIGYEDHKHELRNAIILDGSTDNNTFKYHCRIVDDRFLIFDSTKEEPEK